MEQRLTERQHEVARLAASGLTTQEIAAKLRISPATARDHLDCVRRKLGVTRKREIGRALKQEGTSAAADH